MAARRMELLLTVAIVATLWAGAVAQSSGCSSVILSLSPCLDYITGNSSIPSSSCCSQLAKVVGSQPQCLCEVINGGGAKFGINATQALALPSACNVKTPPLSRCNSTSPTSSPTGSPQTPSGGGTKTVPPTNNGTSDGNSTKLTFSLLFFMFFIASCTSIFTTTI